jgi:hypothetical protein
VASESVVTVACAAAGAVAASPAALVATWLAADLQVDASVVDPGRVQVRGADSSLGGRVRTLLRERRFIGWQVRPE